MLGRTKALLCEELYKVRVEQSKHLNSMMFTPGCDLQLNSDSFNALKDRENVIIATLGSTDDCFLSE